MAATQKAVADRAGVSVATVSRVLRGDPRISDETRNRVLKHAATLGYVARPTTLDPHSELRFGVLLANPAMHPTADHFFGEVLHGITEEAELLGHTVSYAAFDGSSMPRLGRSDRLDGLIVGGIPIQPSFLTLVRSLTVPYVFIGRYEGHIHHSAVLTDNLAGAELATRHLISLGREKVAFLGGEESDAVYADRLEGYRRACQAAGRQPGPVRHGEHTLDGGREAMRAWLRDRPGFDAVFVADDLMAVGALRALKAAGLRVPEDVSVVGYSDVHLAAIAEPPLSTVHVARRRLGRAAARLLNDVLSGAVEAPVHVTVPPKLILRASCGGNPQ
ncbi:MAG TPA: LacI family DNA-binding transcriptional regulator, partial [Deinococcales bacterium]|nr:LacI family DNA-binding transcriptional regulator [Deinococcales bacterium]